MHLSPSLCTSVRPQALHHTSVGACAVVRAPYVRGIITFATALPLPSAGPWLMKRRSGANRAAGKHDLSLATDDALPGTELAVANRAVVATSDLSLATDVDVAGKRFVASKGCCC